MPNQPAVFAVAAHPDDIEFMMSGTFMLLGEAGWDLHYMNLTNGSCGTATDPADVIIAKRAAEAEAACRFIGAEFHPPLCNDLEVFHTYDMIAKLISVIRNIRPRIMLVQSPQDYMEEHMNACRVAATFSS